MTLAFDPLSPGQCRVPGYYSSYLEVVIGLSTQSSTKKKKDVGKYKQNNPSRLTGYQILITAVLRYHDSTSGDGRD